ncbi:MAG: hypothetical protein KDA33_02480, partial [Phycisphaerales bacterium]|nr:hypothetical protein [Phycisphaerales bacterium]
IAIAAIGVGAGGGFGAGEVIGICVGMLMVLALGVLFNLLYILIWGLCSHGVLRLGGRDHQPLASTFRALCYSAGANVSTIVPCVGWYFGWIWWTVSSVIMFRETHRISTGRAVLSVLALPVSGTLVAIVLYVAFIWSVMTMAGPMAFTAGVSGSFPGTGHGDTQTVLDNYLGYAADNGALPDHPVQLLLGNRMFSSEFISSETMTTVPQINWPRLKLGDLEGISGGAMTAKINAFLKRLPEGAFAHRAGDYIFTCPGIDPTTLSPDVWLVIFSPLPIGGPASAPWVTNVYVGQADGTVIVIPKASFQNALQGQMTVRKNNNLPPLPPLSSIMHNAPAVKSSEPIEAIDE